MTPWADRVEIHHGDALDVLRQIPDCTVDAVVTDPPYGLSGEPDAVEVLRHWIAGDDYRHRGGGFMGLTWDSFVPGPAVWAEVLRVTKPGGHLLAFSAARRVDLLGMALRLAGWERRDTVDWLRATGLVIWEDLARRADAAAGIDINAGEYQEYVTPLAQSLAGWRAGLKGAVEHIALCRKPLSEPTIVENWAKWGVGALHIDACRVHRSKAGSHKTADAFIGKGGFPPNVVLEDHPSVLAGFAGTEALARPGARRTGFDDFSAAEGQCYSGGWKRHRASQVERHYDDAGDGSRFFPKASADLGDRILRCTGCGARARGGRPPCGCAAGIDEHPTVKPLSLIQWCVRLVLPQGGRVLDPFAGTGPVGEAALGLGGRAVLIDSNADAIADIRCRLSSPFNRRRPGGRKGQEAGPLLALLKDPADKNEGGGAP